MHAPALCSTDLRTPKRGRQTAEQGRCLGETPGCHLISTLRTLRGVGRSGPRPPGARINYSRMQITRCIDAIAGPLHSAGGGFYSYSEEEPHTACFDIEQKPSIDAYGKI